MLLDVRFLIEFLRSQAWAWTTVAVAQLFDALELHDASEGHSTGRRELRSRSGLVCVLYSEPATRAPYRFEFLVPVPKDVSTREGCRTFLEGCAWPLRSIMGAPAFQGSSSDFGFPTSSSASYRLHWVEPKAQIAVESRPPLANGDSIVALVVERAA